MNWKKEENKMQRCDKCRTPLIPRHPIGFDGYSSDSWEGNWLPKEYKNDIRLCMFCVRRRIPSVMNKVRYELLTRQYNKCNICKRDITDIWQIDTYLRTEIDHIKELSEGGSNSILNLQLLCIDCHKHRI